MSVPHGIGIRNVLKMKTRQLLSLLFQIGLFGIIVWNIGSVFLQHRDMYLNNTYWQRFPSIEKVFLGSQYVNKHPDGWISDEAAFSYAGGKLIKGTNPVLVVPDAPPLGKYLIGLSTIIFGNENIIVFISAIISLILLYILSLQALKNSLLAFLPPLLVSFEKIFTNQLIYTPLLDLFQLVFLLTSFIFFNIAITHKKSWIWVLLSGISIGCFMATKFFVSGLTVIIAWFLVLLLLRKWKEMLPTAISAGLSLAIVPVSYIRVFAFNYSFKAFLGIQKWVFLYHRSQLILPFSIWPLLLINRWYVWFGDKPFIRDSQWSITWPILTFILFICAIFLILKKFSLKKEVLILIVWPFVYLFSFSIGEIFSRYFVILIPILYIVAIYFFQQMYFLIKK